MWFIVTLITLLLLVFYFLNSRFRYWKDKGVPGPAPTFLFGNILPTLTGRISLADFHTELYRQFSDYPFVGYYRMFKPILVIRDPDLIKNMVVKDFKHFQDNDLDVDKEVDKIFGRNPFCLRGLEWKTKRAQLTTCFTSGKIKAMYSMLEEVSHRMVDYITEKSIDDKALLETREVCVRFTLDNVAACVFGLEGQCFKEEHAMFRKLADDFLSPGTWNSFKIYVMFFFPQIGRLLKVKIIKQSVEDQLIEMVREILDQRRKNNIVRNDFLESVAQLYQTSKHFEDELDIVAQAASFFADGYETSSRVMSYVLFELAAHPNCQRQLREEINNQSKKTNGMLTYETVQDMPYLEACIYESLRKYPIIGQLSKICTEKYTYTCTNTQYKNLTVNIDEGTSIVLPVAGLQKDENFFKSPEEYIPERFLNKSEYNKYTFMPFGEGPRSCLGVRFGLTQIKVGVAQIIKNFELTVNSKTQLPLKFDKWYIMLCPIGGLWVDFKKIKPQQ